MHLNQYTYVCIPTNLRLHMYPSIYVYGVPGGIVATFAAKVRGSNRS